jgi:hypothetical protein
MAGPLTIEQIEMCQRLPRRRLLRERIAAFAPGGAQKPAQLFLGEFVQSRPWASCGVEWCRAQAAGTLQMLYKACIQRRSEFRDAAKASTDELGARLTDQRLHLGVTILVVSTFDENEPRFPLGGGLVKLALGRRDASGVLETVLLSEQAQVHGASIYFVQIHVVRPAITGREVFERFKVQSRTEARSNRSISLP